MLKNSCTFIFSRICIQMTFPISQACYIVFASLRNINFGFNNCDPGRIHDAIRQFIIDISVVVFIIVSDIMDELIKNIIFQCPL